MIFHLDMPNGSITLSCIHIEAKSLRLPPFARDGISVSVVDAIASIIKIPSPDQQPAGKAAFKDLECTVDDIRKINEIISKMGEKNKVYLLLHEAYLRKIGDEVRHVHPLKFLSVILSDPYLKSCMAKFRTDFFKWHNFISDLESALDLHSSQGTLSMYVDDFAKSINVPPDGIKKYIDKHEWTQMIDYILAH